MSWDPTWEKVFETSPWGKYPGEDVIRFVARNYYARNRPAVKILEVGCGPGANIWYLAREGFEAHGIDGSATAVRRCEERLAAESLKAQLHVGEIATLPHADNTFDAVLDVECLCCNSWNAAVRVVDELARVLKPGGKLYSRTFAEEMFVGSSPRLAGHLEYKEVFEGPLKGKGFVRLMESAMIDQLYGVALEIETVERSSYTIDNRRIVVPEWQITCLKPQNYKNEDASLPASPGVE
jgi:SAM-dependent methyltransferase